MSPESLWAPIAVGRGVVAPHAVDGHVAAAGGRVDPVALVRDVAVDVARVRLRGQRPECGQQGHVDVGGVRARRDVVAAQAAGADVAPVRLERERPAGEEDDADDAEAAGEGQAGGGNVATTRV
jgi:hypothetical protein